MDEEVINHGCTRMNTDFGIVQAPDIRVHPCPSVVIIVLAVVLTGCATKESARREAEKKAMIATQQSAMAAQANQEPAVWFRGDVRNQRVPWTEGLTLAEALVAAQYTWNWDPRRITLTRQGQAFTIDPRRLLRGQDNPELEPGDLIEVRH
jgi:hypothetical protein